MPNVIATPRSESNGQLTTSFITVAGSAAVTYTYPTQQIMLKLVNRSVSSTMTVTVNGTNYTVSPDSTRFINDTFTVFTITSQYDSQAFEAVSATSSTSTTALTGSNVTDAQTLWTPGMLYNETTSDKPRGNTQGTLLASAARTATASSPDQTNYNARGVIVLLNITVASGTGGLKVVINGKINGNPVALNPSPTAIIATGKYAYEIYPGSTAAGVAGSFQVNQRTPAILPRTWYVDLSSVDATSYTADLSFAYIL